MGPIDILLFWSRPVRIQPRRISYLSPATAIMYLHTGSFVCTSHVSIYIRLRRLLILIRAHRVCLSVACHLRWRNAKEKTPTRVEI
jgi:hypothetical protein